jgi:hypothetical protein
MNINETKEKLNQLINEIKTEDIVEIINISKLNFSIISKKIKEKFKF